MKKVLYLKPDGWHILLVDFTNDKVLQDDLFESVMDWHIPKRTVLYQNDIAILDILAHADFKRPIYFAVTVADENYLNLEKYFQLEGLTYKIVPIKSETNEYNQYGRVNTKILYNNIKNRFCNLNWETDSSFVSADRIRWVSNCRIQYSRLADALINENKPDSASEILALCFESFPIRLFPLDYWSIPHIKCYYRLNKKEKANELANFLIKKSCTDLQKLKKEKMPLSKSDTYTAKLAIYTLNELNELTNQFKEEKLNKFLTSTIKKYKKHYKM